DVKVLPAVAIAVRAEEEAVGGNQPTRPGGNERVDEGPRGSPGGALVTQHRPVANPRGKGTDVQIAVRPEGQAERVVQPAAAAGDELAPVGARRAVEPGDAVVEQAGDVEVELTGVLDRRTEHQPRGPSDAAGGDEFIDEPARGPLETNDAPRVG